MVGANPKNHELDVARRVALPGTVARVCNWRWALLASLFVPLSLILVQCGRAPNPGALAANVAAASSAQATASNDTFVDRFPKP